MQSQNCKTDPQTFQVLRYGGAGSAKNSAKKEGSPNLETFSPPECLDGHRHSETS